MAVQEIKSLNAMGPEFHFFIADLDVETPISLFLVVLKKINHAKRFCVQNHVENFTRRNEKSFQR